MDKLKIIKEVLEIDLAYWEKEEQENPNSSFYRGTVAGLRAFKEKIKYVLEEEQNEENNNDNNL